MTATPKQDATCRREPFQNVTMLSDDTGRAYRQVRREFYERLAALVDMPTRPTATQGIAWRSGRPGRYHSLIVLAYAGSFDPPGCRDGYPWTLDGRPVPRIHLNDVAWWPSRTQERRWANSKVVELHWAAIGSDLELTLTLEELLDFVPWIVAWARASETGDRSLIFAPPHRLKQAATTEQMLTTRYDWSLRADAEYDRRWQAREAHWRRTGRRNVVAAGA